MNRYNLSRRDFTDDVSMPTVMYLIEGSLFVAIFLLIIAVMQNRDLEDRLEEKKAEVKQQMDEVKKYSGLLAECMNGGGMYDRASGTAYFCDKPLEIPL